MVAKLRRVALLAIQPNDTEECPRLLGAIYTDVTVSFPRVVVSVNEGLIKVQLLQQCVCVCVCAESVAVQCSVDVFGRFNTTAEITTSCYVLKYLHIFNILRILNIF